MKKFFRTTLLLALCLLLSTVVLFAASETQVESADALYKLGLFKGTGINTDGSPEYSLDNVPSRAEAITMLVRMLGKEAEALSQDWNTPFTDVPDWAKPYVGYAYNNGLTNGISATLFGSKDNSTATQYLTFSLRALGYESGQDFEWNKAWELSDEIGLTNGEYNEKNTSFLRGDIANISKDTLDIELKDSTKTLADKLIEEKVFTKDTYEKVTSEIKEIEEKVVSDKAMAEDDIAKAVSEMEKITNDLKISSSITADYQLTNGDGKTFDVYKVSSNELRNGWFEKNFIVDGDYSLSYHDRTKSITKESPCIEGVPTSSGYYLLKITSGISYAVIWLDVDVMG